MAKKKTQKKVAKKAAKKKAPKKPRRPVMRPRKPAPPVLPSEDRPATGYLAVQILCKLKSIADTQPEMESVPLESRGHKTTRAHDVFKRYHRALLDAGLYPIQHKAELVLQGKVVGVQATWRIYDLESGAWMQVASVGTAALELGWGGNSASTLAMKQMELETCCAVWENQLEAALERVERVVQERGGKATPTETLAAFFNSEEAANFM